jgi:hypothetical protein
MPHVPTDPGDYSRVDIDNAAAIKNRLGASRTIPAIGMPREGEYPALPWVLDQLDTGSVWQATVRNRKAPSVGYP